MDEFVQTMKDWRRMCESCDRNEKIGCVVNGCVCDGFRKMIDEIDLAVVEAKVTAWAAENPEPVYPTWKEWLEEQRVVVHFDSINEKGKTVKWELTNKSNCHIPADLAQTLGLQPKEG